MIPNPDNNPDKVSGFMGHRAAVELRQIHRHVGSKAKAGLLAILPFILPKW
jgi:hypothetical protein